MPVDTPETLSASPEMTGCCHEKPVLAFEHSVTASTSPDTRWTWAVAFGCWANASQSTVNC